MGHIIIKISCFVIILLASSYSKTTKDPNCSLKETCSDCIRELGCVWCSDQSSTFQSRRCIAENEIKHEPNLCKNIINPKQEAKFLRNAPLTLEQHTKDVVQISPQKIRISLRKGEEYTLNFKYVQAKDYPVDLYYIIDNTHSMSKFKNKLSTLGSKLATTMKKLTKHFRLGFGSFVEKTRFPFVDERPMKLKNPCKNSICASPYTFKNHLSLTNDTERFGKEVNATTYSTNLDDPEADLDALMQAIVCKKEIGWRDNARHLLVLSTDSDYHIAGDGKLAGAVMPHDGECHMENHSYTYGSIFDYPSIAQINAKAIEHNINMIFVIARNSRSPNVEEYYKLLKARVKDSDLGILLDDNSNVVELIRNYYNKITDSIIMTDTSGGNIEVKYYSACTSSELKKTNQCDDLHVGVQVNFTAVIKLIDCPKNGISKHIFQIKPGSLSESLEVEVDFLCDCDCEKQGHKDYKEKAVECSRNGTLKCGVCDCDRGKLGRRCDCDGNQITSAEATTGCRLNVNHPICSKHGTCKCNKCVCNKRPNENELIYGKYCECDNYSCKRHKNRVCSGEARGICHCGNCVCYSGYTGDACECPDNNSTCINPTNKKLCSGRGECKCGECQCKTPEDGHTFSGQYCDECPTCPGSRCEEFQHCVQCNLFKTGMYTPEQCLRHCTKYSFTSVKKINRDHLKPNEKFCQLYDYSDKCYFNFIYAYGASNTFSIVAQKDKECTSINILGIALFLFASTLIGGLLILLIWKGVTTIYDRREYAKFENERKNAKWSKADNPLFQNATTNFSNPTFDSIVENDLYNN